MFVGKNIFGSSHPRRSSHPFRRQLSVACTLLVTSHRRYRKVTHRLHCAMPLSGNFAIQAKSRLQSSLIFHFLFGAIFFNGGYAISCRANMENCARSLSEEHWRLSNRSEGKEMDSNYCHCRMRTKCRVLYEVDYETWNHAIFFYLQLLSLALAGNTSLHSPHW